MFIHFLIAFLISNNFVIGRPWDEEIETGICDGKEGTVVPDPKSCDGFYTCREGEAPHFGRCPNNMWFDRELRTCTFKENVKCELEPEDTTTSSDEPITVTTTEEVSTNTDEPTTTIEATTTTTTVPVTTTTVELTTTTTPQPSTEEEITHQTTNTAPGIPIDPEATAEPGVEEKCLDLDRETMNFLPSKVDCERYYLCYRGKPVQLNCVSGQHWNQVETFCDDPFYAHCQAEGWIDPNPFPDCPRLGRALKPHRTDCSYFVFCNDGVGFLNRCPLHEGWDSVTEKCVLKSEARCYVHQDE